ncbi:unnamed protein product [Gongylonema pulchrum]|uniref:Uncharacterized protein n=1 Tax=Gongylonema pulchrum TaxID=637853 RepID=A0A3P6RGM6_9BILA|nr:unnamed protein product [Gongylonema pulchrum]
MLALIYARNCGAEVGKYLEEFTNEWSKAQYKYGLERRKQMFRRYVSLSRAVRKDPFE